MGGCGGVTWGVCARVTASHTHTHTQMKTLVCVSLWSDTAVPAWRLGVLEIRNSRSYRSCPYASRVRIFSWSWEAIARVASVASGWGVGGCGGVTWGVRVTPSDTHTQVTRARARTHTHTNEHTHAI